MCGIVGVRDDWLRSTLITPGATPERALEQPLEELAFHGRDDGLAPGAAAIVEL